ncbi:hypothetical protein [Altibacter sp.]|uniref:hypothetical protein n=1 Tax=Altibacter sp. TaxID=2024823 RepID=UPI000C972C08|nr:hypothetical protein [Altibacter sp.]MAP54693.1 hypothetical protein [Altibacter sp.]
MAPIKFEENIREKLQERELSPSKDAWSKLEAQLDAQEPKKRTTTVWFAVAAAVVTLLVVGALVYNPFLKEHNAIVVEENPSEERSAEPTEFAQPNENVVVEIASETSTSEEREAEEVSVTESIPRVNKNTRPERRTISSEAVAQVSKDLKKEATTAEAVAVEQKSFEDAKAEEVIHELKKLKESNIEISIEEVDALLAKAQREIQTRRILTESTQKVDAAALLLDVELELERSFRDKVFDALGDGFEKIRTAVTERNN